MKLWHQSFAQLDKLPRYVAAIREHLDQVAAPGTTIDIHSMRPGSHTTMPPGKDIVYSHGQHMHTLDGMLIVPCSMKTLAAIASGYASTLMSGLPT